MPVNMDSPFGEPMYPVPSGTESGPTTPTPGIGTPALNTPPTPNEQVGLTWRQGGFDPTTPPAGPAQIDSVFNGEPSLAGMGSGGDGSGGGNSNGALDSVWTGDLWPKP